jgi:ankyrin repeat protein
MNTKCSSLVLVWMVFSLHVACSQDGCTALHLAAKLEHLEIARSLLAGGASVNTTNYVLTLSPLH